jgi:hypothetical protein
MEDKVRGYPDTADGARYWFTVHHAPSGTKIEGFSVRPDKEKGYPDKYRMYWSYIQYNECGPIKQWMEQKDKNYIERLQRDKEESKKISNPVLSSSASIPEQITNPREEIPVSFKKVFCFCWFQEARKPPTAKEAIETRAYSPG